MHPYNVRAIPTYRVYRLYDNMVGWYTGEMGKAYTMYHNYSKHHYCDLFASTTFDFSLTECSK